MTLQTFRTQFIESLKQAGFDAIEGRKDDLVCIFLGQGKVTIKILNKVMFRVSIFQKSETHAARKLLMSGDPSYIANHAQTILQEL